MEVKKYSISYQKKSTYYSLNVCNLVKEIIQRHSSSGEFYSFSHFQSETNKCLRIDLFYVLV